MLTLDKQTGTGQTVGTATVDLITYAVPLNSTVNFKVRVSLNDGTPAGGLLEIGGSANRGAGTATLNATVTSLLSILDAALATAAITLVRSGNNIIVRGTGVLTKTINWVAYAEVDVFTP